MARRRLGDEVQALKVVGSTQRELLCEVELVPQALENRCLTYIMTVTCCGFILVVTNLFVVAWPQLI